VAIFIGVPIVAVAMKLTTVPFIEIDWLHGIEQMLMAVPVHIMAMSFRQAVLSQEEKKRSLPVSCMIFMGAIVSKIRMMLVVCCVSHTSIDIFLSLRKARHTTRP
jgi:phosphatidylserine synthase